MKNRKYIFARFILVMLISFVSVQTFAQEESIEIAKVALEDKAYKKALKNALDAVEHPETSKNPEAYYLAAISYRYLSEDIYYLEKNPDAIKEAMKLALKGLDKDKGGKEYDNYEEELRILAKKNNAEADANYKINKISKALGNYQQSFKLVGDTTAFYWLGKLSLLSGDTATGRDNYLMLISWYYESYMQEKKNDGFFEEPFVYFADHFFNKGKYDSANYYLDLGRTIFGATSSLDFYQKKIAWHQIEQLPPSNMMLEVIQKTLKFFPLDTALLKKENALYLYLMRNSIASRDTVNIQKYLKDFCDIKVARSGSKDKTKYEKVDDFIEENAENVMWLLSQYYYRHQHFEASGYMAGQYIRGTATSMQPIDLENRWVIILDHSYKTKSLDYTAHLIDHALMSHPKSKTIADMRKTITLGSLNKELSTIEKGSLRDLLIKQPELMGTPEVLKSYQKNTDAFAEELISDKQYALAKSIIRQELAKNPKNPEWTRKLVYLAKEDFYYNYYETRTRPDTVAGMISNHFEWKGDISRCNEGSVDDVIQRKVENRINYFRRNAGVPEIYLDPEYNRWCQKAAFMMEVNRKLDHEPKKNWSCYSEEGATAARYSLLIQNSHTSYAVTSFVADNDNKSLGNRRWMLYHNGKMFGHGSTDKYCSIWALDDSGATDTAIYSNSFVAWPPEGYTPEMVVFKNWSFGIYRDLKGAKVSMTEDGKPVALVLHPTIEGYGMPTLCWTPQITFDKTKDRSFEVSIILADGRLYKYIVHVLAFDPVGY